MPLNKNEIIRLLTEQKYKGLLELSPGRKKIISALIPLTYDKKSVLSWRAVEAIGLITGELAKSSPELARNIAGRLIWMIRDESGGIGWSSPEILGEIVRNSPDLFADIATVIVSFHDEPPLRAGVLRAVGRIGKLNTEMVKYAVPIVIAYLVDSDPTTRGLAAWALGEVGSREEADKLEALKIDKNPVMFYENGEIKEKTVGGLAAEAIRKLKTDSTA